MLPDDLNFYYNRFKFGEDNFHNLMSFRIRKILLIATFYDAYIIEHDGRLTEQITGDYFRLNLTTVPRITSVPTGEDALKRLKEEPFDLIITTLRTGSSDPFILSKQIHESFPDIPILLLLTVKSDMEIIRQNRSRMAHIDNVFLWTGDSRLFIAMIKYVEDRRNAPFDTEHGFVRVILLVEDSVDFYSRYLPMMYQEIMQQTQKLIREELNDNQKYYLMRTRPKILLVKTFEEAIAFSSRYASYLLAVISDIQFDREGQADPEAGMVLIRRLKKDFAYVPMLLQSSEETSERHARSLEVDFLHKHSINLMDELRRFIVEKLGFGDFIFKDREGKEVGRASSLEEMEKVIHTVPIESILLHASRNHFSAWLVAHGEFQVARSLRSVKISDFPDIQEHRRYLEKAFQEARANRLRGKIVEFAPSVVQAEETVLRLREGSLGGKGRGLAFCNALLVSTELNREFSNAEIRIPRTLILGTDEYDQFLEDNRINARIRGKTDEQVESLFQKSRLSRETEKHLGEYLDLIRTPLAVRSSSLLEDSHTQPFAGVYETCLIPNAHPNKEIRRRELVDAVKRVYASAFLEDTRRFIAGHGYRQDEEKMGIVIQELAGQEKGDLFYPSISGVAQSFNYYPSAGLSHSDPVASLAVGLGKTVVEGGLAFRYCPSKPRIPCLSLEEQLRFTQTGFYALAMSSDTNCILNHYPLSLAEEEGILEHLASVFYQGNLEDGLFYSGPRVVNFSDILRYDYFPLSAILSRILGLFEKALGCPAEIEFAVDLKVSPLPVFYLLQIRPMSVPLGLSGPEYAEMKKEGSLVYTENSLGHGILSGLYDMIYLPLELFDRTCTEQMRDELKGINRNMKEEGRRYILLAPGRWGSADRFLGIPVSWPQIDQAAVIVEAAVETLMVEPSQGSHFFHNITACGVGYLMVREGDPSSVLDWDHLGQLPGRAAGKYFRHIRLEKPFKVILDGKKGIALIRGG